MPVSPMPLAEADLAIDRELAALSSALPLLRYTTPINAAEALEAFADGVAEPDFAYLPLPDLSAVADRLAAVDVDAAVDPVVGHLARDKKHELEVLLDLLGSRGTDGFLLAAVELFGHVEQPLLDLATDLLEPPEPPGGGETVAASAFAEAARAEIAAYRATHPALGAVVHVDGETAGLRVERGDVYIGVGTRLGVDRIPQLLAHEVGVHVLTYANGAAQPLQMLAEGLAGYDETQEALGMLAEHLCGGLPLARLRTLARRVLAAHLRSRQVSFADTVQHLLDTAAGRREAFMTAMRAHRAGGMTKDAVYLRGLVKLCEHLARGGELERLFIGKIALEDEPLIAELVARDVLRPPALLPGFMTTATARDRLAEIRAGRDVRHIGGISA